MWPLKKKTKADVQTLAFSPKETSALESLNGGQPCHQLLLYFPSRYFCTTVTVLRVVQFCMSSYAYDYRQNWTPLGLIAISNQNYNKILERDWPSPTRFER